MPQYDLLIQNGTLVTSSDTFQADLAILDGKIAAILAPGGIYAAMENIDVQETIGAPENIKDTESDGNRNPIGIRQIIDARGKFVLPGLIDAHVHFRDPGLTEKEDFLTGTRAAAFGGITMVIDMPNVVPVVSNADAFKVKCDAVSSKAYVDYGFFVVLTDESLHELDALKDLGAIGYKIYIGTSVGNIAAPEDGMIYEMMCAAAQNGMRTGFHAENNAVNEWCTAKLQREGVSDAVRLPDARPSVSEAFAVSSAISFSEATGAKIHIYHVSSKEAVALIRDAKRRGVPVTAETCPHYLLYTEADYLKLGGQLKAFPPIRHEADRTALWEGVADGTIDLIATDHAPHTDQEKSGDLFTALAGVTGVETMPRLLLNEVNSGRLTINDYVRLLSESPAKVWGLYPEKGSLLVGTDADITIVDPQKEEIISADNMHSKWKQTVFDGIVTKGIATTTIVRGKVIMHEGQLLGKPGFGKHIRPSTKEASE